MNDIKPRVNIIRKINKPVVAKTDQPPPDLSFLDDSQSTAAQISQPQSFLATGMKLLARPAVSYTLAGLFIFSLGVIVGARWPGASDRLSADATAQRLGQTKNVAGVHLAGSAEFQPGQYYKVGLLDDTSYYARISTDLAGFYLLSSVFYEEIKAVAAESNKLTLVKYGTEADQPSDELYLPREQVRSISPLSKDSPILRAIEEYLIQ